jgi:hypothetical protein
VSLLFSVLRRALEPCEDNLTLCVIIVVGEKRLIVISREKNFHLTLEFSINNMEKNNGMSGACYNCVVITDLRMIGGSFPFVACTISEDTSHGDTS